jgi:hypothetical protein
MKTKTAGKGNRKATLVIALSVAFSGVVASAVCAVCAYPINAHAKAMEPSGLYSDAKTVTPVVVKSVDVADQAGSASPAGGTNQTAAAKPAPKPATSLVKTARSNNSKGQTTIIEKAKSWVLDKWARFQGVSNPPKGVTASRAVNTPTNIDMNAAPGAQARVPAQLTGAQAPVPVQMSGASAPQAAAPAQPTAALPSASVAASAAVPAVPKGPALRDLPRSESGVAVYKRLPDVDRIPLLDIGTETRITADRYALDKEKTKTLSRTVVYQMPSPPVLTAKQLQDVVKPKTKAPGVSQKILNFVFSPKGKVDRTAFDKIKRELAPEKPLQLAKYVPLTPNELRFLQGLHLYQKGDKCAAAIGFFHQLAKTKSYEAEGTYYLAMCSKKLGLTTDFIDRARKIVEAQEPHYTKKIVAEVSPDVPSEYLEPFGKALLKAVSNKVVDLNGFSPDVAGNLNYILANYGANIDDFKITRTYATQVPLKHPKWHQAQFLLGLAEYQVGSKSRSLKIQEELAAKISTTTAPAELQALVALNLARVYFQEKNFKGAREWFLKVYKDHPLWLQSLQEMGWAQLLSGDHEGAIGNMYSVQSPYFNAVYKPESYVIRTIGYLNLCQYGDAYRTLTILERTYRPWLDKMAAYQNGSPSYFGTLRKFIASRAASAEIDGLPAQVIREMARHKDYLNLQNALNRQVDERALYAKFDKEVADSLARATWLVNNSRKRVDDLRAKIASIKKNPQLEQNRLAWKADLDKELDLLNAYYFDIDVFTDAKATLAPYKAEVGANAEKRITSMRAKIETTLGARLKRMREDLARVLENNELLRYEVFSGSGENIRFQVAGGEKGNRIPANVQPKSKTLQWEFDGEYWEDEIGHYRSSLKNNCPEAGSSNHARLEEGIQ